MFLKRLLISFTLAVYVLSITGCGVLLYPERQGQKSGRIDPAIAIFDGIGLLFFLVPGLVAFAVDFHQGTIYLPNTQASIDSEPFELIAIKVEGPMTRDNIEATLNNALGTKIDLSAPGVIREDLSQQKRPLESARLQILASGLNSKA